MSEERVTAERRVAEAVLEIWPSGTPGGTLLNAMQVEALVTALHHRGLAIVDGLTELGDDQVAVALLYWYDHTHGNEFGHDHHCPLINPKPPAGAECSCGWSGVQRADMNRNALQSGAYV